MNFDFPRSMTILPAEGDLRAAYGGHWPKAAEIAWRLVRKNLLSEAQNHRCCHCGRTTDPEAEQGRRPTTEHVIAQVRGGPDTDENVVMACARCNGLRGDRVLPEEGLVYGDDLIVAPPVVLRLHRSFDASRIERVAAHRIRLATLADAQGGSCARCGGTLTGKTALTGWREGGGTRHEVVHASCYRAHRDVLAGRGLVRSAEEAHVRERGGDVSGNLDTEGEPGPRPSRSGAVNASLEALREGGQVRGEADGVVLFWSPSTPAPGRWVSIDEDEHLDGVDDGWMGWELGWAPDGTERTSRRIATFETRDCLTSAWLAIEDPPPRDVPGVEEMVATAGFGDPVVAGGATTWSKPVGPGRTVTLRHARGEVVATRGDAGAVGRDLVASASTTVGDAALAAFGDPVRLAFLAVLAALDCASRDRYMGR